MTAHGATSRARWFGLASATMIDHSSRCSSAGSFAMLAATRRAFVLRQDLGLQSFGFVRPAVDVGERLPVGIASDVAAGHLFGVPGRGEAAICHPPIIALNRRVEKRPRSSARRHGPS
jgi:hypothetical protein